MFENWVLTGKYTNAEIMINTIDAETQKQIVQFINDPNFGKPVAIMPDCHAGKGAVVGFTMPMCSTVIPNVIGVDIGCGMLSINLRKRPAVEYFDEHIRSCIPFGTEVHKNSDSNLPVLWISKVNEKLKKVCQLFHCEYKYFDDSAFSKCATGRKCLLQGL